MCELFGMSCNIEADVHFSFKPFKSHARDNPDGWGIAFYSDSFATVVKEPRPADESKLAELLGKIDYVRGKIVVSHIGESQRDLPRLGTAIRLRGSYSESLGFSPITDMSTLGVTLIFGFLKEASSP